MVKGERFGVETISFEKSLDADLDDNWGIEDIELRFFNELEQAQKYFSKTCERLLYSRITIIQEKH